MSTGEIIIFIAYIIGFLFTIKYQKNKIDTLRIQVKSQKDTISNIQRFMDLFKLDVVERYVQFSQKTAEKERDEAIKVITEEWQRKTELTGKVYFAEYKALLDISLNFVRSFAFSTTAEQIIRGMNDSFTKGFLIQEIDTSKKSWHDFFKAYFKESPGWIADYLLSQEE